MMLGIIGVSGLAGAAIGSGICYLWIKKSRQKEFSHLELEAKAKAKAKKTDRDAKSLKKAIKAVS